jgi:hypothetical protein
LTSWKGALLAPPELKTARASRKKLAHANSLPEKAV